jgi:hypothetical protein
VESTYSYSVLLHRVNVTFVCLSSSMSAVCSSSWVGMAIVVLVWSSFWSSISIVSKEGNDNDSFLVCDGKIIRSQIGEFVIDAKFWDLSLHHHHYSSLMIVRSKLAQLWWRLLPPCLRSSLAMVMMWVATVVIRYENIFEIGLLIIRMMKMITKMIGCIIIRKRTSCYSLPSSRCSSLRCSSLRCASSRCSSALSSSTNYNLRLCLGVHSLSFVLHY